MRRQVPFFELSEDEQGRRICTVPWSGIPYVEPVVVPRQIVKTLYEASLEIVEVSYELGTQAVTCWVYDSKTFVLECDPRALVFIEHTQQIDKWAAELSDEDIQTLFEQDKTLEVCTLAFVNQVRSNPGAIGVLGHGAWESLLAATRGVFPGADDAFVMDYAASLIEEHGVTTTWGSQRARSRRFRKTEGKI